MFEEGCCLETESTARKRRTEGVQTSAIEFDLRGAVVRLMSMCF